MILGALLKLSNFPISDLEEQLHTLIEDSEFSISQEPVASNGLNGVRTHVHCHQHTHHHHDRTGHHHHHHRDFKTIRGMIEDSSLPAVVKELSIDVFANLAEAEGRVHGKPADDVHFHEVGAVDSIVDIVGACFLLNELKVEAVGCSALPVGSGTVKCQHGVIPIPVPATLELLKGFPVVETDEPFELLTPTGAALLMTWITKKPVKTAEVGVCSEIIHSFGHRTLKNRPNLLRATLFDEVKAKNGLETDTCVVLETNIDDCNPEIIGSLFEKLLELGALDVFSTSVSMKKQRMGVLLTVLTNFERKNAILEAIFRETSSFGVRERISTRHTLTRRKIDISTPYGTISVKVGTFNGEDITFSPEFDDCQRAALQHGVPVKKVYESVLGKLNSA